MILDNLNEGIMEMIIKFADRTSLGKVTNTFKEKEEIQNDLGMKSGPVWMNVRLALGKERGTMTFKEEKGLLSLEKEESMKKKLKRIPCWFCLV